ncbi:macro domain-containing protein [Christiangramia aquimixticola]|uniref:macro domain-containing protein n=1 Tax=Christiangramia aquimixticola TaxID=1697558 RepID=UPI003AA81C4C
MEIKLQGIDIGISKGNIADQPGIDVVVNAANPQLAPGGGVAGAIHDAAGPQLYEECKPSAPIYPGEAVITRAYALPNQFVLHTLGPVYGRDHPEQELLASCYRSCLQLAEEHSLSSIAFPAISTGIYGYPPELAVKVVFNALLADLPKLKHLKKIKFVLFSETDLQLYEDNFKKISLG